jgi:tetratricopeptide (TPR) repeat protein
VLHRLLAAALLGLCAWGQILEQGKRAFEAGDYTKATRLFEKAYQESKRCEVLFFLGLARYRLSQVDAALIAFQSATQCDPKLIPAYLAIAEAYIEKQNDGEALAAFHKVLKLAPGNRDAMRGAASIYLRSQANEKAVPLLEKLAALDAMDPRTRIDLAAAYAATGDRDRAERTFRETLRLQPGQPSALMGLANLHLKKGEEEQAIGLLEKAIATAPVAFEPRFLMGSACNRLGRFQEAANALQNAIRMGGGESPEVHYQLARALGGLGKQEERRAALARFTELTRKSKQDTENQRMSFRLVDEARALVDAGNLAAAAAKMEEARELRPTDAQILFRLGGIQLDLRRYDVARNCAQEAISLAPSEWLNHFLLAQVELRSARWQEARASLEVAVKLKPDAAEVHNALGDVALQEKNLPLAIASFERAVQLDPQQAAYKLNLESARRALDRSR